MVINKVANVFTLENDEIFDILVVVKLLDDEGNFTTIDDDRIIVSTMSEDYTLNDGEYVIEVYNNFTAAYVEARKLLVYETIQACILTLIKNTLLDLPKDCDCDETVSDQYAYKYSSVSVLWFVYLNLLNKIMVDNFVFASLSNEELLDLQRVKEVREGIEDICIDCSNS